MYPIKTPKIVRWPYPELIWRVDTSIKEVFLTFDDGPIPEVTPWVLETLEKYNACATFFMVGENVAKHPDVFNQVVSSGNSIGNHTYNHLVGWKTDDGSYEENVKQCEELVQTNLFRPPHGRIKKSQIRALKKQYKLIMWDVLSGDFDTSTDSDTVVKNVLENVSSGSIIVFHDSIKAWPRLKEALPVILEKLKKEGYSFGDLAKAISK
jgi:peptidoglycan/xylan/chitin deacetylase (PgdA/CDA1 family)